MMRLACAVLVVAAAGCASKDVRPVQTAPVESPAASFVDRLPIYPFWIGRRLHVPPDGVGRVPIPDGVCVFVRKGLLVAPRSAMAAAAVDPGEDAHVLVHDGATWRKGAFVATGRGSALALIAADIPASPIAASTTGIEVSLAGIRRSTADRRSLATVDACRLEGPLRVLLWRMRQAFGLSIPKSCARNSAGFLDGVAFLDIKGGLVSFGAGMGSTHWLHPSGESIVRIAPLPGNPPITGWAYREIAEMIEEYTATWGRPRKAPP